MSTPVRTIVPLLIDGNNLVMRCHMGYREPPLSETARNSVSMIQKAVTSVGATHCVVAFDDPAPSFRKLLDSRYKAKRSLDTNRVVAACRPCIEHAGIACVSKPGWEGDDMLGTLAARLAHVAVVSMLSHDKDMLSLVSDRLIVYRFANKKKNGGRADYERYDVARVCEEFGVPTPAMLTDIKSLSGEDGDGISGIPDIGFGKARAILLRCKTVDWAFQVAQSVSSTDMLAKLIGQEETVALARQLATIRCDVDLGPMNLSDMAVSKIQWHLASQWREEDALPDAAVVPPAGPPPSEQA